ncbi:MAG: hypothetical protein ACQETH_03270 [Candidatus Rifleibacteriota bacterium]
MNLAENVNYQPQGPAKLALKLEINEDELELICRKFAEFKIDEELSPGLKAVNLVKFLKHIINLKFDKTPINDEIEFITQKHLPAIDKTKAKLLKGLFITFLEYEPGLPGLVSIINGVAASGFGIGKFSVKNFSGKIKLSKLNNYEIPKEEIQKAQADFFDQTLTPQNLSEFANIRLGVYCQIVGCALIPFYFRVLKHFNDEQKDDMHLVQEATEMAKARFSGSSENLHRFTRQNLFRVIFEELFNYESTVFSIFQ